MSLYAVQTPDPKTLNTAKWTLVDWYLYAIEKKKAALLNFNASLASINLAKAYAKKMGKPFSIISIKTMMHNAFLLERFIVVSGIRPQP